MDTMDDLIARIKTRVADPFRIREAAAWVRPIRALPLPATLADVAAAEKALGFPLPPLLQRLYTEVGNGGWGPVYGLWGIPVGGADPDMNDLVGFYLQCTAPERALEDATVVWPRGLVTLLDLGCVSYEVCDFLSPPHPVYKLSGDTWDPEQPVRQALTPVADSLTERLESWLTGGEDDLASSQGTR